MVTQVEPVDDTKSQTKFRRLSDSERGLTPGPKFEENDKRVLESLYAAFPLRAETAHRDGAGKRIIQSSIYSGRETNPKKRQDTFNPKYGMCPAPVKDMEGKYTERCCWQVAKPTPAEEKAYNNPKNRVGVFKDVSITQWQVMMHHKKEHWDWWRTENGRVENHGDKTYERPPFMCDVVFPVWEAEE